MKYDFDKTVSRRGTNCYKYDSLPNDDTIALWVADMDFETAPCIQRTLLQRVQHGCYGYTRVPETFYESVIQWFSRRHGWHGIQRDWILYTSGVVPAVSAIIKAMTVPGDKVLLQTPAYNCFFSSIRNNGCEVAEVPLLPPYSIDFEAFEQACSDPAVKLFLLCNPHNPTGRVWTPEELRRMGEICRRHDVFVIADEIHCEFVNHTLKRNPALPCHAEEPTPRFHPFMSVSDTPCAVCLSPSKAFNIAGLQIATIVIADDSVRRRVNRAINVNEVCDVNPFGVLALEAAYSAEGEEWLDALNDYIYSNYRFAQQYIEQHIPHWQPADLEGTYLLWVNIGSDNADDLCRRMLKEANVYINTGTMYDHSPAGEHYIRINLATQRARLEEALRRIGELNIKN